MDYAALNLPVLEDAEAEIWIAELADFPFESFETQDGMLKAYIPEKFLNDYKPEVDALLGRSGITARWEMIASRNWNAEWEKNFTPVLVDDRLLIRAPFHDAAPQGVTEVVVTPRMAFGSGHHATTCLMAWAVMDLDVRGRRGLDMGSGTGVLAILAAKCGAEQVDAVDIDEWADTNCRENIAANGVVGRVTPILGDVQCIAGRSYDFILANINRNTLMAHMSAYAGALAPGGDLLMSGFLVHDIALITACAEKAGLTAGKSCERDGWAAVRCRRG